MPRALPKMKTETAPYRLPTYTDRARQALPKQDVNYLTGDMYEHIANQMNEMAAKRGPIPKELVPNVIASLKAEYITNRNDAIVRENAAAQNAKVQQDKSDRADTKAIAQAEREGKTRQALTDKLATLYKQAETEAQSDYKYWQDASKEMMSDREKTALPIWNKEKNRVMTPNEYQDANSQNYYNKILNRHGLAQHSADYMPEHGRLPMEKVTSGQGISAYLKANPDMTIADLVNNMNNTPYKYNVTTDLPQELGKAVTAYMKGNTSIGRYGVKDAMPREDGLEPIVNTRMLTASVSPGRMAQVESEVKAKYDDYGNPRPVQKAATSSYALPDWGVSNADATEMIINRANRNANQPNMFKTIGQVMQSAGEGMIDTMPERQSYAIPQAVQDIASSVPQAFSGLYGSLKDMGQSVYDYWSQ